MVYDAIVIGVGSMGASTCFQLAKRGARVLGLEQFDITHENGSHTGQSRLIRKAYMEHPDYVPLLFKALEGWKGLERESNTQLYWETGIAYFGETDNESLTDLRKAADLYDIPIQELDQNQIREKWAQFKLPKEFVGVLEPEAGFLIPEKAIKAYVENAQDQGAEIHTNEEVTAFEEIGNEIHVSTNKGEYRTKKLIVTAGAFSNDLFNIPVELKVTRQYMAWADTDSIEDFWLGELPCWIIAEKNQEGIYYGFPDLSGVAHGPKGVKVAYHRPGEIFVQGMDEQDALQREEKLINDLMNRYFADPSRVRELKKCKYTYSPDDHFIVDRHPKYQNVIIASGFSGHGFKFAPVIGEALTDLALSCETDLPIEFLGLGRFC